MDGGERLERCLSITDSEVTEEEEEVKKLST